MLSGCSLPALLGIKEQLRMQGGPGLGCGTGTLVRAGKKAAACAFPTSPLSRARYLISFHEAALAHCLIV